MNRLKPLALALAIGGAAMLPSIPTFATVILTFGQAGGGSPIVGTNVAGTTTITGINIPITITQIDAPLATPIAAFLTFSTHNIGPAVSVMGFIFQRFAGTFSITNGGTNFLSGTLTDAMFGAGASLTLSASMPGGAVTFNSNVIPASDLAADQAISLAFANVTPGVAMVNGSLGSFTSSIAGTFSATPEGRQRQVSEPGSLALVGLAAFGALGFSRRKPRSS